MKTFKILKNGHDQENLKKLLTSSNGTLLDIPSILECTSGDLAQLTDELQKELLEKSNQKLKILDSTSLRQDIFQSQAFLMSEPYLVSYLTIYSKELNYQEFTKTTSLPYYEKLLEQPKEYMAKEALERIGQQIFFDFYAKLGVKPDCTEDELNKAIQKVESTTDEVTKLGITILKNPLRRKGYTDLLKDPRILFALKKVVMEQKIENKTEKEIIEENINMSSIEKQLEKYDIKPIDVPEYQEEIVPETITEWEIEEDRNETENTSKSPFSFRQKISENLKHVKNFVAINLKKLKRKPKAKLQKQETQIVKSKTEIRVVDNLENLEYMPVSTLSTRLKYYQRLLNRHSKEELVHVIPYLEKELQKKYIEQIHIATKIIPDLKDIEKALKKLGKEIEQTIEPTLKEEKQQNYNQLIWAANQICNQNSQTLIKKLEYRMVLSDIQKLNQIHNQYNLALNKLEYEENRKVL